MPHPWAYTFFIMLYDMLFFGDRFYSMNISNDKYKRKNAYGGNAAYKNHSADKRASKLQNDADDNRCDNAG